VQQRVPTCFCMVIQFAFAVNPRNTNGETLFALLLLRRTEFSLSTHFQTQKPIHFCFDIFVYGFLGS